ncbi:hypothetical protein E2562_010181 [Oryza meyeriana var. granulata]|uniref:Uncharacterized protein n=1 Tax=Oryza meyeriana var. granulata TaxID=110450 RepID=A0A6G1EIP7_9ORYZ|nr:hypothetical protein E2562_010181 [Oryza meyeriana var. granulata]
MSGTPPSMEEAGATVSWSRREPPSVEEADCSRCCAAVTRGGGGCLLLPKTGGWRSPEGCAESCRRPVLFSGTDRTPS